MTPRFLEKLQLGSNIVEEMRVNVREPATLLFARHVEALLRDTATFSRSSWDELEDEYWTVFNCNPDETDRGNNPFALRLSKIENLPRLGDQNGEALLWILSEPETIESVPGGGFDGAFRAFGDYGDVRAEVTHKTTLL